MTRGHFTGILTILFAVGSRLAAQELIPVDQLGRTLTFFYVHPDSSTLKSLIRTLQNSQTAREALPPAPVIGFFTAILLSSSPNRIIVNREFNALNSRFDLFDYALAFGKSQDTIIHWKNRKPDSNDLIWGAYFGTGDTRYLDKLLGETKLIEREDSLVLYMTGASAKWSISSNARQHESIKKYLTQRLPTADEKTKKMLTEILTRSPGDIREEIMNRVEAMKSKTKK